MGIQDMFTAKEKDDLLKKVYRQSSQVKYGDNPVPYSYATSNEYEVAVIDLFIKDQLIDRIQGVEGYATYRHAALTPFFINKGGYRKIKKIKRRERLKDAGSKIFISVASSVVGLIIGAILGRLSRW